MDCWGQPEARRPVRMWVWSSRLGEERNAFIYLLLLYWCPLHAIHYVRSFIQSIGVSSCSLCVCVVEEGEVCGKNQREQISLIVTRKKSTAESGGMDSSRVIFGFPTSPSPFRHQWGIHRWLSTFGFLCNTDSFFLLPYWPEMVFRNPLYSI